VFYYPTIKPFDAELLNGFSRVLVVEEHSIYGGIADDVRKLGIKVDAICIPDEFQRGYGTRQDHLNALGFTPENIALMVRKWRK
jgi:transketolase C-terminal domain/subunit